MIICKSVCQFTIKRLYKIDTLFFHNWVHDTISPAPTFLIIEKVTLFPMTSSLDQPFFFNPYLLKPQLSKLLIYLMLLKCISSHMHTCKRYLHLTRVSNNSPQQQLQRQTLKLQSFKPFMYLPHATKMHKLIPTCMQTLSSFDTRLQQ